jgi:hypothetical protein
MKGNIKAVSSTQSFKCLERFLLVPVVRASKVGLLSSRLPGQEHTAIPCRSSDISSLRTSVTRYYVIINGHQPQLAPRATVTLS